MPLHFTAESKSIVAKCLGQVVVSKAIAGGDRRLLEAIALHTSFEVVSCHVAHTPPVTSPYTFPHPKHPSERGDQAVNGAISHRLIHYIVGVRTTLTQPTRQSNT